MNGPAVAVTGSDLAARLSFAVGTLNRRLRPAPEVLSHLSLSALASIQRAGAIRPGDLARVEGIAAPGTTRLVAQLEQHGFVVRSPDPADGRSHLLRLTDAGVAAIEAARAARAAAVESMLTAVSAEDRDILEAAVGVLERALLAPAAAVPAA